MVGKRRKLTEETTSTSTSKDESPPPPPIKKPRKGTSMRPMYEDERIEDMPQFKPFDNQVIVNEESLMPFPKLGNSLVWNMIAKRRTGKSTLWLNVLLRIYNDYYTDIYLFSPSAKEDDKCKVVVDKLDEKSTFFQDPNQDELRGVMTDMKNNIREYKKKLEMYEDAVARHDLPEELRSIYDSLIEAGPPEKPHHLVIIDDCVAEFGGDPQSKKTPIARLYNNSAHHWTDVWTFSQVRSGIHPCGRINQDMFTMMRVPNDIELDNIMEEQPVNGGALSTAYFHSLVANNQGHELLHLHTCDGGKPTIFRGDNEGFFHRLKIPPEDLLTSQKMYRKMTHQTIDQQENLQSLLNSSKTVEVTKEEEEENPEEIELALRGELEKEKEDEPQSELATILQGEAYARMHMNQKIASTQAK